jgi:tripartite-type tricarboxylate transporter receptor subunit TctC
MQPFCRRSISIACGFMMLAGSALISAGSALAENYPSHPVKIVVPFPAGGSNDIVARVVAQKLSERNNGQTFFVENRGGAGGNIGAEAVAGSDPDGYTLLLTAPPRLPSMQHCTGICDTIRRPHLHRSG